MEDEDGESKIIDMWDVLEDQRLRDSTLQNTLRHSIDDVYTDVVEEERQLIRYNLSGKNTVTGPRLTFRGFKKRILAQSQEIHTATSRNNALEQRLKHSNAKSRKNRRTEGKRERKITEYAQYLGLQPSARYRCSKCHAWSNCNPNSKQNSCACNLSMTPMPSTSDSSTSVPHASSFKITRKVYLCSACGTYFENWNLFLHMRDIHKRHICLYCLGMFGQAERLSYHLMKKHSVPEMTFNSTEDFYSAFKGSCCLVCCSCEKIFSETDDFFNHFCSPPLKQDATDIDTSMCTICRQVGTHADTCSLAQSSNTDKELCSAMASQTIADATRTDSASPSIVPPSERTTNLGGKGLPRKTIKYNRSKHGGNGIQTSRQQKSNALTRKLGTKTPCNDNQLDLDSQREFTNNIPRDTVTETIMEVSRYTGGNSTDENDENDEQAMNKDVYNNLDRGLGEKSPAQFCQLDRNEPYDSVTETIMEVSRYTGEENQNKREEDPTSIRDVRASHVIESMNIEKEGTCDKRNVDSTLTRLIGLKASSPMQRGSEETTATTDARTSTIHELETESGIRSCDSLRDTGSCSPINRSLFSPQHESHISDLQSKEKEHFENIDKKETEKSTVTDVPESHASVSFNTVAPSDRSLVIKIRNRNSQFTVATAESRESEENNNAEGSTSKEKISNGSKIDGDIADSGEQANELDDTDSDSDKLAVVDSNPEEDEEAEDGQGEGADEIEEIKERHDDAKVECQKNEEGNSVIGTTNEMFAETISSSAVRDETIDNNGTEETARSLANEQMMNSHTIGDDGIALAGKDVPCIDLNVEGTLDSMELEELLKRCIEAASPICVYCNHARHIAVNGRQLGLHILAEHKFQPQHPAIIIHLEQFTARVKRSLNELESHYFNLNTYNSANGTFNVPDMLVYECFHCRFHSAVHKDLYLHNRKMHQKTLLVCIMCKSTFYSYSELLCHLCPGVYSPNVNLRYRCCLCSVTNLPSAFRLMVHLRKRHHACDVCLESTGNQQRLSNHVWKHKLHHLCYRCGIAYRNKPDITKHLFWKHGTESVLCRKCLQKKWPHIYHFCIPPTAFVCEECGSSFGRAVALKVHKRLHSGDLPYGCEECAERFISRKLLAKHQAIHREPEPEDVYVNVTEVIKAPLADKDDKSDRDMSTVTIDGGATTGITIETTSKNVKETMKKVVDVYDLPPLNLSSESDTDNEEEKIPPPEKPPEKEEINDDAVKKDEIAEETTVVAATTAVVVAAEDDDVTMLTNDIVEVERNEEEKKQEARIMDGIWDNFKTYAASLDVEESAKNIALKESVPETDAAYLRNIVFSDHDYCVVYFDKEKNEEQTTSKDENAKEENCTKSEKSPSPGIPSLNAECETNKRKTKTPKKKKRNGSASSTSDSSSDTDSSSCSCGTNCSCSSSSSGSSSSSSSSSDSDSSTSESSPRKQASNRKDHNKKEREAAREKKSQSIEPEDKPKITIENGSVVPEVTTESPAAPTKLLLLESDLETEETETDEDFYDEHPQQLANKLLTEKRNQLMLAAVAPSLTPTTPTSTLMPTIDMEQPSTPLNNGILNTEMTLSEPIVTNEDQQPQLQQKKKTKTKRRRKGERGGKRNVNAPESIKLNIPKAFYQKNPGFVASSPATLALRPSSRSSTPNRLSTTIYNDLQGGGGAVNTSMEIVQQSSVGVGISNRKTSGNGSTETENKRVSKRKRVPKRFYGDSSDDEPQDKQPAFNRWRKIETNTAANITVPSFVPPPPTPVISPIVKPVAPPRLSFSGKTTLQTYSNRPVQVEQSAVQQQATLPETLPIIAPTSATESEDPAESSSDSSESEAEDVVAENQPRVGHNDLTTAPTVAATERPGKIYCYCRCPYDEVSEMIACDGEECHIEWFHFECVGIMVPPKGKWYCPDCRKKYNIVQNNDDHCD